jgi:hypothetical protein
LICLWRFRVLSATAPDDRKQNRHGNSHALHLTCAAPNHNQTNFRFKIQTYKSNHTHCSPQARGPDPAKTSLAVDLWRTRGQPCGRIHLKKKWFEWSFFVDRLRRVWHNASRSSRYVSSASGRVVETVSTTSRRGAAAEKLWITPRCIRRAERKPRLKAVSFGRGRSVEKARTLHAAKPESRLRNEEVLPSGSGSDPFCHSVPTVKSTRGVRKGAALRGAAIGTNA